MIRQLPLVAVLLAGVALGAVPRSLTQHGRLFDGDGAPITGSFQMKFTIYDAPAAGTPLWTETQQVAITDGYFVASLGDVIAFPSTLFGGAKLYLGITVNDDDEMAPRELIASVPYALVSGDVSGDIHPDSVSVGGTVVIDNTGNWVGPATGLIGPAGPAGATGPAGPTGPAGADGAAGAAGPAGAAGATGPAGAVGATGPAGADGPEGPAGVSVVGTSLNVGDPDCPAGGARFVAGSSVTFACNGAQGAPGAPGVPGAQGPTGLPGVQGPPGTPGAQGPQGVAGAPGAAGAQGPQGVAGAPGAPGATGAQGPAGPTGAQGLAGATGPQGPPGATGATGPQGPAGATGAQGPAGSANINGATNYLVKFTSATAGGSSLMFDNGTGVGIGTTSPSAPLHVTSATTTSALFSNTSPTGAGVYAQNSSPAGASSGIGVVGITAQNSANAAGVWAQNNNTSGTGLIGFGNNNPGATLVAGSGAALNGTTTGVFARTSSSAASQAVYTDNFGEIVRMNYWSGSTQFKINGVGTVSTVVRDPTKPTQKVTLYAPESPEILFTDYGTGRLRNGRAHVELDPRFSGNVTIDERHPLRVFVQLEGDENSRGVIVTKKTATGFDVVELDRGRSNATFQWQATANRADEVFPSGRVSRNADARFGVAEGPLPTQPAKLQGTRPVDGVK